MRKRLLRKTLDMVAEIADRTAEAPEAAANGTDALPEKSNDYKTFWEAFGRNLKLGVIEDSENRKLIAPLLRFQSSSSGGELIGLQEYVQNMPEEQKAIYYLAADTVEQAEKAPFLEALKNKGYEVLYLVDPIDEVAVTNLATFEERQLVDVSKEDIDLGLSEEEKKAEEEKKENLKSLTEWMKTTLGDKVEKVVVSARVTSSPCVLVTSKYGWSANMERIMKSQAMGDTRSMEYMRGKKIMEVNPESAIIKTLAAAVDGNAAGTQQTAVADLLYETALLTSGFQLDSPTEYAERVFTLMEMAGGGDGADVAAAPEEDASTEVEPEVIAPDA